MEEKEYHLNYQLDLNQKNAQTALRRIEKLMNEKGASTISIYKDEDYASLTYGQYGFFSNVHKNCIEVLNKIKEIDVKLSTDIQEHSPKVVVEATDVKSLNDYEVFISKLAKKNNAKNVEKSETIENSYVISFKKTEDRQNFQTEYVSKAGNLMKSGQEGVLISPDWDNKELCTESNYVDSNKMRM